VLAIQYGYMPGLIWIVVGVCLAGAVQDMLVLAASVRRGGRSLAEIARACEQGINLMDVIVDAVPARITEGEITGVLKRHYGTWNPPLF